jgi:hypothetical protein
MSVIIIIIIIIIIITTTTANTIAWSIRLCIVLHITLIRVVQNEGQLDVSYIFIK